MTWDGKSPHKHPITVKWGDCDPAGIIYTPRVFDYATEAVESWFRDVLGVSWSQMHMEHNMGAPTVHAECDFIRMLAPNLKIGVEVRIERVGRSSVTFLICGLDDDGHHYFRAKFVSCFVGLPTPGRSGTEAAALDIPASFREKMLAYQKACGDD